MISKYFHKLSEKQQKKAFDYARKRKWTWEKFNRKYKQPSWCQYHDALIGVMGCWSLVMSSHPDLFKDKCDTCEYSLYHNVKSIK